MNSHEKTAFWFVMSFVYYVSLVLLGVYYSWEIAVALFLATTVFTVLKAIVHREDLERYRDELFLQKFERRQ